MYYPLLPKLTTLANMFCPLSPQKRRKITLLAWFCCHIRDQWFFFFHSIPNLWKSLSQHLHFLRSPLLLNLLFSRFCDHQNTIIIFLQVTYDLLFSQSLFLKSIVFPEVDYPSSLTLPILVFSFVLVTIQFWFSSYFSNQLLSTSHWFFVSSLQMGYHLKFWLQSSVLFCL